MCVCVCVCDIVYVCIHVCVHVCVIVSVCGPRSQSGSVASVEAVVRWFRVGAPSNHSHTLQPCSPLTDKKNVEGHCFPLSQ